jgi:hypothetical protein
MTESDPTRNTPTPRRPLGTWDDRIRLSFLTDWVAKQRGSFTDAALERTALTSGYTHEEFVAAIGFADVRLAEHAAISPIRSRARMFVLAAYAIVWGLFAIPYLLRSSISGPNLQTILTISLGIGLALSLVVIQYAHPDPERRSRAMALLLAVPVILLLGVAGTCLPFVSVQ